MGRGLKLVGGLLLACIASVAAAQAPANPAAVWLFETGSGSQALDSSGQGNSGTLINGAAWVGGFQGFGIGLDGTTSYVEIPDSASLDFSAWSGATVAAWVKPSRLDHNDEQTIFGHWNKGKGRRTIQLMVNKSDRWECRTNNGNGIAISPTVIAPDTWTHLACVWSPAGLTIYVDGSAEAGDVAVEPQLDDNPGSISLGVRDKNGSTDQHFQGDLDEVYIYDRALDTADVQALWGGGSTPQPARSNGAPTGVLPAGTSQANLSLTTDVDAICRYSTAPGTDYLQMTMDFSTTGGTAHSTPVSGLQDGGSYGYFVRCSDLQGNANTNDFQIAFSVDVPPDLDPPSVSITSHMDQDVVEGVVVVTADAMDNIGVVGVQFHLDGSPLGAEASVEPYSVPWDTLDAANGLHTLTAVARDAGGNMTTSDAVSVSVANPEPEPTLLNGQPGGTLPDGTTEVTLSVDTRENADCRYATVPGVDYDDMPFSFGAPATVALPMWFPPPGQTLASQEMRTPEEVGLDANIVADLRDAITNGRWALWRDGYLVHVEGDFNETIGVKSARKTIHAATVGVALDRGWIPSLDQKIGVWNTDLVGKDADVTWRHVITQTSAFDDLVILPGDLWAYSDANPRELNNALARVWGKVDYYDNYQDVLADALFDEIGMMGWSSGARNDGVRLTLDLEDFGRFGLLMLAGGSWDGSSLLSSSFVDMLGSKQTYGIPPLYDNENDGHTGLDVADFPEAPYGFMTWVNTDQDLWPEGSATWASAFGLGGHHVAWDTSSGLVLATLSASFAPIPGNPSGWPTPFRAAVIAMENNIAGPDPLLEGYRHATAISGLQDGGAYAYYVRCRQPGGTTNSADFTISFDIDVPDTELPSVSISSPGDQSMLQGPVGVSADATDNIGVVGVQFYLDGSPLEAEETTAPYSILWNTLAVADGFYTLTAEARDAAGNVATSAPIAVEVVNDALPSLMDGLVALWRMDEGAGPLAGDSSGNANTATLVNSPAWVGGYINQGLSFNGTDSYLQIADSPSLDFSAWSGATVSMWVQADRLGHSDEQTLYGHWSSSRGKRTFQIQLNRSNEWEVQTNNGDGTVSSSAPAIADTWTHVAAVWSSSGLTLYINGLPDGTDLTVENQLDANDGEHTLGVRNKSGALSQFHQGEMDEVYIYDRALSAAEISLLYLTGL